jgi:K+-transporting ATPase ATPase A chain
MLVPNLVQPLVLLAAVVVLTPPLGGFVARVMGGERTFLHPLLGPVERVVYRSLRLRPDREQTWTAYGRSLLAFSPTSIVALYLLQRVQGLLPFNADGFGAVEPYVALNTAVSFVTNTNWQNYLGEQTMSHLTQMAGLAVQNFVSAGSAWPWRSRSSAASPAAGPPRSATSGSTSPAAWCSCCCRCRSWSPPCSWPGAWCRTSTGSAT